MYDVIVWKNRRTEKNNTYSITTNADGTITLTPVVGAVIDAGTSFNQTNMMNGEHGTNEAIIIANAAMIKLIQHQRELENTYFEVGSVSISTTEDYPFNTQSVTVAMRTPRNTLDYVVMPFCDDPTQGRAIRIKDRQLNGFKIEVTDCPKKAITVKYFVFGGKM